MITKDKLIFFSLLQLVVVFAMIPLLVLGQTYGQKAVVVYAVSSLLILCAFVLHLWEKGARGEKEAGLGALGLGIILAFLSAEIVTVCLMIS